MQGAEVRVRQNVDNKIFTSPLKYEIKIKDVN